MRTSRFDKEESASSSDESEDGNPDSKRILNFLASSEDPRTLSQIKRSRIDLARRYVFLCPTSLSKHFDSLPHQAKDGALLVFRCSRNWLFAETSTERTPRVVARINTGDRRSIAGATTACRSKIPLNTLLYRSEYSREFLQWVLTKEKEGCVFWFKPERDLQKLSKFFEEKIDPVSEQPYRPLLLDPHWWRVRFLRTSARFVGSPSCVIATISQRPTAEVGNQGPGAAADMAIPTLQELIYQSNPTLEPLARWPHAPSMRFLPREPPSQKSFVQDARHKGYIEHDFTRNTALQLGVPQSALLANDHARISRWPELGHDRFDNLHGRWQVEEASARRQQFAMHGFSTFANTGSLTAR